METPIIRLSEAAKRAIQDAAVEAGGDLLRITVSDLCVAKTGSRGEINETIW